MQYKAPYTARQGASTLVDQRDHTWRIELVLDMLEGRSSYEGAALTGISEHTLQRWRNNREEGQRYAGVRNPVKGALWAVSDAIQDGTWAMAAEGVAAAPYLPLFDFLESRLGRVRLAQFLASHTLTEAYDVLGQNRDALSGRDAKRVREWCEAIRRGLDGSQDAADAARALPDG